MCKVSLVPGNSYIAVLTKDDSWYFNQEPKQLTSFVEA